MQLAHITGNKIITIPESLARLANLHYLSVAGILDHTTHSVESLCLLIAADNPLDSNRAIPVLLAVLLNNPNLQPGKTSSGLFHSISNASALDEFKLVDRSNRARALEWLTQRREQACDDAVRIAQQQSQAGCTH